MITVTLYYHSGSDQSDAVAAMLDDLQSSIPHHLVRIDVGSDPALVKAYGSDSPVIAVGPYRLRSLISKTDLQVALAAAQDRARHLDAADLEYKNRVDRGRTITGTDRFTLWFSRSYIGIFNLLVFIYVGLPFLAPVLMKANLQRPARIIYTLYSPLCHQLAFRSWFLFGQQAYYPRALAEIPNLTPYEELAKQQSDLISARAFVGNEQAGYKVAFCQRDIAIYGAIFLFGMIFWITGRRLKPAPWYLWVVLGLVPIGVDGVSQLPSLMVGLLPDWLPLRESTPFLRTLTGGMFGWMTAWYVYPLIEEAMSETRRMITRKMAVVRQTQLLPEKEQHAVQPGR
ncbi:MAG: DUF2085 domain-containing protein [Anaerolineaceae bacterium]|nr:DUF2085 domain-containing protein [Anaerolineaceae bacterium]